VWLVEETAMQSITHRQHVAAVRRSAKRKRQSMSGSLAPLAQLIAAASSSYESLGKRKRGRGPVRLHEEDSDSDDEAPAPPGNPFTRLLFGPPQDEKNQHKLRNHYEFLDEDVDFDSMGRLSRAIRNYGLEFRSIAHKNSDILVDPKPQPFHVHINSPGGVCVAGLPVIDQIESNEIPVHTHIEGQAASMGAMLAMCGAYRTITRNSRVLIHQLSGGMPWGTLAEMEDDILNKRQLMSRLEAIIVRKTTLPKAKLRYLLKHDLYLTAEQCLEWGFVDEIIEARPAAAQ
jgi:ATP-dependent Clp endopeptidase proteolytic subunit ClpP